MLLISPMLTPCSASQENASRFPWLSQALVCLLMKLNLLLEEGFVRVDQSVSLVLSSPKSSTGHFWNHGTASCLGAQSSITRSSYVQMPPPLLGVVSLTPTCSLFLSMTIGLLLSATLTSMLGKSSRFQMFCFRSQKISPIVGLMFLQIARSLLRPGKTNVVNLASSFPLLSDFSVLSRPLISTCPFITLGRMPIRLTPLPALYPCRTLSYLRRLGPLFKEDLGAPLDILWTSWPSIATFGYILRVLLSSPLLFALPCPWCRRS